jgi:hypothetical protein
VVDEDNIWWIAKTELDFRKVLPRASKEAIAAINAMLNRYRPGEEAIIIRRSRDTMEPLLVQKGGHVESPGVLSKYLGIGIEKSNFQSLFLIPLKYV